MANVGVPPGLQAQGSQAQQAQEVAGGQPPKSAEMLSQIVPAMAQELGPQQAAQMLMDAAQQLQQAGGPPQ